MGEHVEADDRFVADLRRMRSATGKQCQLPRGQRDRPAVDDEKSIVPLTIVVTWSCGC